MIIHLRALLVCALLAASAGSTLTATAQARPATAGGMLAATFAGPIGWLAIAIGGVGVMINMNRQADDERVCLSSYLGPGNW